MNVVDVGTPSDGMSDEWTTTVVRFHGFANLSTTRGQFVKSTKFSCFGHQWRLYIYPGGRANSDEGYAVVALSNQLNTSIKIQYGYSVRDAGGKEEMNLVRLMGIRMLGLTLTLPRDQRL